MATCGCLSTIRARARGYKKDRPSMVPKIMWELVLVAISTVMALLLHSEKVKVIQTGTPMLVRHVCSVMNRERGRCLGTSRMVKEGAISEILSRCPPMEVQSSSVVLLLPATHSIPKGVSMYLKLNWQLPHLQRNHLPNRA
jgi:hypothetical protein